jgi:uncharacterized membrane protein YgdD (TMEM256/DUF423 family)
MEKKIVSTAAILGMLAIVLGAFGAHALREKLNLQQLATFETGVKYQMYHAIFLLFIGTTQGLTEKAKATVFYLTLSGVQLFSGSIYLLATKDLSGLNFSIIGIVTPIGGLLLISSWFVLLISFLKKEI